MPRWNRHADSSRSTPVGSPALVALDDAARDLEVAAAQRERGRVEPERVAVLRDHRRRHVAASPRRGAPASARRRPSRRCASRARGATRPGTRSARRGSARAPRRATRSRRGSPAAARAPRSGSARARRSSRATTTRPPRSTTSGEASAVSWTPTPPAIHSPAIASARCVGICGSSVRMRPFSRITAREPRRPASPPKGACAGSMLGRVSRDGLTAEQREIRDLVRTLARERIAPRAAEIDQLRRVPVGRRRALPRERPLRAHVRRGVRRRRRGRAGDARRDRGDLEGLRDERPDHRRAGARRRSGSSSPAPTSRRRAFCRRSRRASGSPRTRSPRPAAGSDSGAIRTEARRDGDEYVLNGSKRFITNAGVAHALRLLREDRSRRRARGHRARSWSRRTRPGSRSAASSRRWGSRARRPASSSSPTAASRRRTGSARRARASGSRCGCSTARGPASPRRGSGSRRARPTTRSSTRGRARRSASRSAATSSSRGCSPTWRRSARRRAACSTAAAG